MRRIFPNEADPGDSNEQDGRCARLTGQIQTRKQILAASESANPKLVGTNVLFVGPGGSRGFVVVVLPAATSSFYLGLHPSAFAHFISISRVRLVVKFMTASVIEP